MNLLNDLRRFFPYYGSKWSIAKRYPYPKYDTIIEPFAGAAGYATRFYYKKVILNDIDPIIYCVWNYLINVSESEILSLPNDVECVHDHNICYEAKFLIGFWLSPGQANPAIRGSSFKAQNDKRWSKNSVWCEGVKERIASQLKYIRHWKLINDEYYHLENSCGTWYIDPPYHKAGKGYGYNHIIYSALAYWCKERHGQVIVCEEEGADWLPFEKLLNGKASNKKTTTEVMWTNVRNA